jgi:HPt (histidine-containing phosphotransfer) domain-containing protein
MQATSLLCMTPTPSAFSLKAFEGSPPSKEAVRARALAALGDDSQLFDMLMPHFCQACPDQANALVQAARGENAEKIRHCAHTLKGSLLTVGASDSAALAARIEAAARQGELTEAAGWAKRLASETALLVEHLRSAG